MTKTKRPAARTLHLGLETLRTLSDARLPHVVGGLPRRTITCNDECDSYACFDTYC